MHEPNYSMRIIAANVILLFIAIAQIALLMFTGTSIQQNDLLPRLIPLFIFITFLLWGQLVLFIKYPNEMDRINNILYLIRLDMPKGVKKRQKAGIIIGLIIVIIMSIVFAGLIVSYVSTHFLWILMHFAKVTSILGLIVIVGCIGTFVLGIYFCKKRMQKVISKNNIVTIGLIIENLLIAMVLTIS